jgi:hypothetical protein
MQPSFLLKLLKPGRLLGEVRPMELIEQGQFHPASCGDSAKYRETRAIFGRLSQKAKQGLRRQAGDEFVILPIRKCVLKRGSPADTSPPLRIPVNGNGLDLY